MPFFARAAFAGVVATAMVGAQACSLDFDTLSGGCRGICLDGGGGNGGDADGSLVDASSDARSHDGSVETGSSTDGGNGGPCPGTGGPAGVRVDTGSGSFCIDATEVTNAQYLAFTTAKGGDTSGQIAKCSANSSYLPTKGVWPGNGPDPVIGMDWCDAVAFCTWAGKRLCGKIGGGGGSLATANDPVQSMWYFACTRGGTRDYPYGTTFDSSACTTNSAALAAAGSKASCQGGFDGIFDLSGNVEEWTDECEAGDCLARGGTFGDQGPTVACATSSIQLETGTTTQADRGFRCCAP